MAESVDCSEFCRLCLVKEQVNTHIFEELGELQQIHVKITACLPIKVAYEDSLPKRICDDCIYKLDQQYQFWNTTVNSEKQLKQWLSIVDEPTPKQETEKNKIKKEKEQEPTVTKTRPRRNARRKAAQNVRLAAAAAIAASDSDAGIGGDDMEIDHFAKEENDSDEDYHDNTESLEENTYTNVGLDSEEQAEAGPSGLQKSGAVASANSGSDNGGAGNVSNDTDEEIKLETIDPGESYEFYIDPSLIDSIEQPIKPHTCDICDKQFANRAYLTSHKKIHTTGKHFECDICHKKFNRLKTMRAHKIRHTQNYRAHCKLCSIGFYTNGELTRHNYRKHRGALKCGDCPYSFQTAEKLETHRLHSHSSGPKKFQCRLCEKAYTTKSSLDDHILGHHEKVRPVCEVCGKSFLSAKILKIHSRSHTGERPFKCEICGKCFPRLSHLRRHEFAHSGVKPFECSVCGTCFTQKCSLKVHMRKHTGETPYKCTFCDKEFTSQNMLKTHLSGAHRII